MVKTEVCIQRKAMKLHFKLCTYHFRHNMLDLSAQHFLFGDPMIKTTYKIDDAPTIPYDSVIKPYCDAGPQRYKRYGPCLDLSGAAVNGNIYRKSVKEVTFYEQTSGIPDESVLEEECYEEEAWHNRCFQMGLQWMAKRMVYSYPILKYE